jgi:protein TonB
MIWDDPVFLAAETDADDLLTLTAEMIVREVDAPPVDDAPPVALAPPTLAHATAASVKPWRGFAIAAGLHGVILVLALGLIRLHVPLPAPQGVPISLMVVPAGAQSGLGSGAAPAREAVKPVPVQPPRAPATEKLPPQPPVRQPDMSSSRAVPLPPKPVTARPAAPAAASAPPASAVAVKTAPPNAGVTRPARAISTLNVYYSLFSREAGQQGQVGLEVWVLANGQTGNVIITRSSGYAALDNVARNAVLGLRFQPALKNGVAVTSVLPYVFRFELQ